MSQQTILLLDDDPQLCAFLATVLESQGFRVVTRGNSFNIVHLVNQHQAKLLISDLVMPEHEGMEGIFQVLYKCRIPIIAISRNAQYLQVVSSRVTAVLTKPIDTAALIATVKQLLPQEGAAHASESGRALT